MNFRFDVECVHRNKTLGSLRCLVLNGKEVSQFCRSLFPVFSQLKVLLRHVSFSRKISC